MNIEGLDNLVTIQHITKDNRKIIRQGYIEWVSDTEFWFLDSLSSPNKIWCKTDYWTVINNNIKIGKIFVKERGIWFEGFY